MVTRSWKVYGFDITRNSFTECEDELEGQLSDGIFENSRVGYVEEIGNDD